MKQRQFASLPASAELVHLDLFKSTEKLACMAEHPDGYVQKAIAAGDTRFFVCITFQVGLVRHCARGEGFIGSHILWKFTLGVVSQQCPGEPIIHLSLYFALPSDLSELPKSSQLMWRRFLKRDDDFRNQRWKVCGCVSYALCVACISFPFTCCVCQVIPRIAEGSYFVKRAIGTKPALLGMKLQHDWKITDRYMDVTCDVGSSSMASVLVGMLKKYAKCVSGWARSSPSSAVLLPVVIVIAGSS